MRPPSFVMTSGQPASSPRRLRGGPWHAFLLPHDARSRSHRLSIATARISTPNRHRCRRGSPCRPAARSVARNALFAPELPGRASHLAIARDTRLRRRSARRVVCVVRHRVARSHKRRGGARTRGYSSSLPATRPGAGSQPVCIPASSRGRRDTGNGSLPRGCRVSGAHAALGVSRVRKSQSLSCLRSPAGITILSILEPNRVSPKFVGWRSVTAPQTAASGSLANWLDSFDRLHSVQ